MADLEPVVFEVSDSIGVISLNNPPANILALPEFIPINLFKQWTATTSLKGLIIKGDGKNFSAGGNLDLIFKVSENPDYLQSLLQNGIVLLNSIHDLDIPAIAAINCVCFGGGLEIALACHIRVASENALLAFPEANQNLMPGMGGIARLQETAGLSQSAKMILSGDLVNATDAKYLGFIDYIAPKNQAFEFAMALMQKMTNDRPVKVIKSIMKALKNASELPLNEAMEEETRLFCSLAQDEAKRRKTEED
jgi:enoyl-CoA hydratase